MTPQRARYSKIDRLVEDLLLECGIHRPPVPIEMIAKSRGAEIVVQDFKNEISGLLLRTERSITIAVDAGQAPTRQRFTIAHELGHLLLHKGQELRIDKNFRLNFRSPDSSTAEDIEEVEANAFAASILMPSKMLSGEIEIMQIDADDEAHIRDLAARYRVSVQAMTIRLMNLFGHRPR